MSPAKSERFEMRLEQNAIDRVDRWRGQQDDLPSRAEAMRRLVEVALTASSATAQKNAAVTLSDGEKLIIAMLADVYVKIGIKNAEVDPAFVMDAIYGGHLWALKWDMSGLFHDYLDRRTHVEFVTDTLDMFDFIERGLERLSTDEKKRVTESDPRPVYLKFAGFDGNNEAELMSIALFLVEKMGRYSRFKGRDFNSHMPVAPTYQRMLAEFRTMRETLAGGGLSAAQIVSIMKVAKH